VSEHVCVDCGARFTVPEDVQARYPGWTPQRCRRCHGGRRGGRRRAGAREQDRTLAEVLERFDAGPVDGVFTDGAADPNPGPGGWGAVYVRDGTILDQAHGHEQHTTNNRMELTALLHGIALVPDGMPTTVYTDSKLCHDTLTKWAPGWKQRGWRRKSGPIANLDLVQALHEQLERRPELRLAWIPAHEGTRWNEYADALATAYRRAEL
jgi:ribonuclease HI